MTINIRKELIQAKKLYKAQKIPEAFEIYSRHYKNNPKKLDYWDKVRYCWSIYYLHIKYSTDELEILEYADLITDIIGQADLNQNPVCVYTNSIFKVINSLKSHNDWGYILCWLDLINPDLLNNPGKDSYSIKQQYYALTSKALLECGFFDECIEISNKALNTFHDFNYNGDVWHKFRISKALKELNQYNQALSYLDEVVKVKPEWFVFKEISENHYHIKNHDEALRYAVNAFLSHDSVKSKVNLYYLIYEILKDSNYDLALKHAELYVAIKRESRGEIPEEIRELEIENNQLNINLLESELRNQWMGCEIPKLYI